MSNQAAQRHFLGNNFGVRLATWLKLTPVKMRHRRRNSSDESLVCEALPTMSTSSASRHS